MTALFACEAGLVSGGSDGTVVQWSGSLKKARVFDIRKLRLATTAGPALSVSAATARSSSRFFGGKKSGGGGGGGDDDDDDAVAGAAGGAAAGVGVSNCVVTSVCWDGTSPRVVVGLADGEVREVWQTPVGKTMDVNGGLPLVEANAPRPAGSGGGAASDFFLQAFDRIEKEVRCSCGACVHASGR